MLLVTIFCLRFCTFCLTVCLELVETALFFSFEVCIIACCEHCINQYINQSITIFLCTQKLTRELANLVCRT